MGQIYGVDFVKTCGLLRIYKLYLKNFKFKRYILTYQQVKINPKFKMEHFMIGQQFDCLFCKSRLQQVGIYFLHSLSFPGIFFIIKKLDIEKIKTTQCITFKTDRIKVVLVFLISNFSTDKNFQGRKFSAVQLQYISFSCVIRESNF